MKFENEKDLDVIKSADYTSSNQIGIVVKTAEELGTSNVLGVYLPKVMMGIDFSASKLEKNVSISHSKIKNKKNTYLAGTASVKTKNYINIIGLNIPNLAMPQYAKYEKVFVSFVDNDIKSAYFLPYTLPNPGKRQKGDIFRIGAISKPPLTQKNTDVESSKENFYYMEFDTINKRIVIQNSQADMEKYQYTVLLDAKNGTLSLADGKRAVTINSANDQITLQNEASTIITLKEDTINMYCKKFNLEAEESITMKTKDYKLDTTKFAENSKEAKINHKTLEHESTKGKYTINNMETTCITKKVSVPLCFMDCTTGVAISGAVAASGMSVAPSPPSDKNMPSPSKGSMEVAMGNVVIKTGSTKVNQNSGAVPVVKFPQFQQIITLMCVDIDKALSAGSAVLPPTSSASVLPQVNQAAATSLSST